MATTTGGFSSEGLALESRTLELESLSHKDAIEIGEIALDLGFDRGLGIAVEVRLKEWTVFHASLPGSTGENDSWIARKARVVLAPLRFGAGIKGKLLEAMQCGTPSVTTSIGAESMNGELPWNGFITDNPNEFAAKAISLYNDKTIWNSAQNNGIKIIEKRYLKSDFVNEFKQVICNLETNLNQHRLKNFMGSVLQHQSLQSSKYMSKWIEEKNK